MVASEMARAGAGRNTSACSFLLEIAWACEAFVTSRLGRMGCLVGDLKAGSDDGVPNLDDGEHSIYVTGKIHTHADHHEWSLLSRMSL